MAKNWCEGCMMLPLRIQLTCMLQDGHPYHTALITNLFSPCYYHSEIMYIAFRISTVQYGGTHYCKWRDSNDYQTDEVNCKISQKQHTIQQVKHLYNLIGSKFSTFAKNSVLFTKLSKVSS